MTTEDPSNPNVDRDVPLRENYRGQTRPLFDDSRLGFGQKLLYRRVPQAVGIYLAGSWTFLEFFESLVSRYNISPHWQDISLLAIVLLFPSLLILAYRHGAPGRQNWTLIEKVGIPSNLIVAGLLIVTQFADKDLGRSADVIKAMGPDGSMIELERPKDEFRKRVGINFFTIKDQSQDQYLALGLPIAIQIDMSQDPYLTVYSPSEYAPEIKKSNFKGLNAPLSLMLKISKQSKMEFLVVGSLNTTNKQFVIESTIYNVNDGLVVKKMQTAAHSDVFSAVDDLSRQLRMGIGFSDSHLNHITDLPIEELLTSSMPAFTAYVRSMHEKNFNNDFAAAEIALQTAIELDEGFAMATAEYAIQTLQQFRTEEGLALLEKVKIYNYKLTDSLKFSLATIEAIYSDQPEVARGIVNQWLALYPDSVDALELKVNLHSMFAERLLAIETLRKIIELEPFGTIRHLTIGRIFTSMGDIESAIEEYQLFLDNNPTNAQALMLIGDANRTLGNFDKARNQYNKAKLLLTNDLSADRRLSNILMRSGDFNQAEKNIKAYLDTSKSADENYTSWKEIVEYYWLRGQYSEAILALKNSHQVLKSYQAETTYYMLRSHDAWRFIKAGYPEEAKQIIADAKLLSDKGGRIYTANVMIAEARLDGYNNQTEQALNSVDEVSKSLAKMLGKGVDYQIYLFKGLIQFEGKLYQQAYENLERYLNTNRTDNNDIKVAKGISLLNIGNISQAQETFEEILKEYPSHPLANLEMAKIEMNYEKPESAKRYIKKALKAWEPADSNFASAVEAKNLYAQIEKGR